MGRTKVVVERIENEKTRQVSFNKRRIGLLKKALELSILCDVEVSLMIRSAHGDFDQYSTLPLDDMLEKYDGADRGQKQNVYSNESWDELFGGGGKKGKAAGKGHDDDDDDDDDGDGASFRGRAKRTPRKKKTSGSASAAPVRGAKKRTERDEAASSAASISEDPRVEEVAPTGPALLNDFTSSGVSPSGTDGFAQLARMLPTPSWNPELEAVLGVTQLGMDGASNIESNDNGTLESTSSDQTQLQGASVSGKGSAKKKRRQKGPSLSLSVDTNLPNEFAQPQKVARPGSASGQQPSSPAFMMLSPQSAEALWLITPGQTNTPSFSSFGLGAFPPTPPTNTGGGGNDIAAADSDSKQNETK